LFLARAQATSTTATADVHVPASTVPSDAQDQKPNLARKPKEVNVRSGPSHEIFYGHNYTVQSVS